MESHLIDILVCPLCKGRLQYDRQAQELICQADKLAFPVRDGIPVMLESEARSLAGAAAAPQDASSGGAAASSAADAPSQQAGKPDAGA